MEDNNNNQCIHFASKLVSDLPENQPRKFMISFFLSDHTIQNLEAPVVNSGFKPGKFLQRTLIKNPKNREILLTICFLYWSTNLFFWKSF
jgi:hypothetical protein